MTSPSDRHQGQSRTDLLDPEDPAMSETGSPGVSVPFTAGMVCHCWQAREGIKETARLSQCPESSCKLLRLDRVQISSRSLSAKSEPCPGKYRAQGAQPLCGDVQPTQLPSRRLQNQRGVTTIAEAGHLGRAYP